MNRFSTSFLLLLAILHSGLISAQSIPNNAFRFNETGTVKVSNFGNPAGDFSVEAWAKVNSIGTNTDDIISTHENPNPRKGYFLEYAWGTNSVLKAGIANSSNNWSTADYNANWQIGQWHHVVMTYNATAKTIKLYQDGSLVATDNLGSLTPVFSNRPFGIGCSDNYTGNGFAGSIDDVYFWNRELSATEIDSAAHLFRAETTTGLKACYRLDTLNGTTVTDMTANALHGTAGNMSNAGNVFTSYAPIEAAPVAGYIGYKGNWSGKNVSSNAGVRIISAYTDEQNYTLYAHNADSGITTTGLPVNLQSRLKRVWNIKKYGTTPGSDTLRFSLSEHNIVSNVGTLYLLKSTDGNTFSYADSIAGVLNGDFLSFVIPDTLNSYFTVGSDQVINLTTLNRSVAAGTDDAEECVPGGSGTIGAVDLTSSDLEIMLDGTKKQMIGVRFANITIPPGSVIQSAYLQFATKGDKNPVLGDAYLSVQDADNATTFTSASFNVTSRPRIADSILWLGNTSATWGLTGGGTAGPDQKTPELKTLVQPVINRAGWSSGNALALFLTGAGVRNAYSFDGSASGAAKLIIQYIAPVTPQMPVTNFPIAKLSQWKYLDDGSNQDTAWRAPAFNDATWAFGPGKLGYSDNPATTLGFGPDAGNKYITYYFRKKFNVADVAALTDSLDLNILRDDAAVVFINGVEAVRSNFTSGAYNYLTFSSAIVDAADESTYYHYSVPKSVLVNGLNTIAVEIHQRDGTSSDLGFDMELTEHVIPPAASLIRGPYLNAATPNSIVIRWRTDVASMSKVRYGTAVNALSQFVQDSAMVTEHIVKLTGLTPYTRYFYGIGSLTDTLQADSNNYFSTLPVPGLTDSLIRIGVIGDCGNNSTNQRNVRDQLISYLGSNYMNSWILLGDNAYSSGLDAEFQAEFFNIYKDRFLKQTPLFPAPGNHDYGNSTGSPSVTNHMLAPYYQNFTMPIAGEAGGTASNNPAFYSYDVGNVHFLSLDSYGKEADASLMYDTNGVQVQWIKQDLANNTNKGWVVAYWHHPPYTMGSHNSDNEGDLVQIRQKFIQILERMGVDLILCGHSHDYERSKLMKGHYGNEASFDANVHHLSSSSALYDGSANSCPYVKDSATNYQGAVYVVSGSAGQLGGQQGSFPHNAMYYSDATHGGAMILEAKGNRLDAKWICADGVIRDQFTMMKDANKTKTINANSGVPVTLTAAYNGTYSWQGVVANTKSVTVTPSDTTTYVVSDSFNCIRDTFVVNIISTPLPLSWGYIRASAKNDHANLVEWQTLSEHNTAFFEIERSEGNGSFGFAGKVNAGGNSDRPVAYQLTDGQIDPSVPVYLYRIRQVDIDGHAAYSPVVSVTRQTNGTPELIIAPNPARSGEMVIALNSNDKVATQIQIGDITGRKVVTKEMTLSSKPQLFLPSLQNGVYFLSVTYPGQSFTRKIVIRN